MRSKVGGEYRIWPAWTRTEMRGSRGPSDSFWIRESGGGVDRGAERVAQRVALTVGSGGSGRGVRAIFGRRRQRGSLGGHGKECFAPQKSSPLEGREKAIGLSNA